VHPNFGEFYFPRTRVNKGKKKGVEPLRPHPFQPSTP
jgi:hypothetical protein